MINLAPWYYRNLLGQNDVVDSPEYFTVDLINGVKQFEVVISLKSHLKPSWDKPSSIYRNCDGSGTSTHKNIATYKAISEALERYAFFNSVENYNKEGCFDINPSTTGMAAFPHFKNKYARENAKLEAIERWAIHEFNNHKVPVNKHQSKIENLDHYELVNPTNDIKVSLLCYKHPSFWVYAFAGGKTLAHSFEKALIELDRNIRVLSLNKTKDKPFNEYVDSVDRTLVYFSTKEGNENFLEKIKKAPQKIINPNPKILCDLELKGPWSKYTKVWRYLLEDSYFNTSKDHEFFMF